MKNRAVTRNYFFEGDYLKWYTKYEEYVSTLKISDSTRDWRLKHIRVFINYLQDKKIALKDLTEKSIIDCIKKSTAKSSKRTIENRVTCFKYFLLFLRSKRVIKIDATDIPFIIRKSLSKK